MTLPAAPVLKDLEKKVLEQIRTQHVKHMSVSRGPVFLISNAYPGVWMEHAYDAIAYARLCDEGKETISNQLHLFLDRQREDGQFPCYVLDPENIHSRGYKRMVSYAQLQECVSFASLCLEGAQILRDEELLKESYEKCVRWENWLVSHRMTTGRGLIETFCMFDTGHDWSSRLEGIPGSCPDADAAKCNPLPFLPMLSPDLNAIFFATRRSLSRMAELLGKINERDEWLDKSEETRRLLIQYCYDPDEEFFFDADRNGNRRKSYSIACMSVFQEHAVEGPMAEKIYRRYFRNPDAFWTPFPFPSMSASDPKFARRRDGNDWGYYSQGLTALRALRWMDDYGKSDDLDELLRRWITAQANDPELRFSQELDPFTGTLSQSSADYSSALLVFAHGMKRLFPQVSEE